MRTLTLKFQTMGIIFLLIYLLHTTWAEDKTLVRPNHGVIFTPDHRQLIAGHSYMDLVFTTPRPRPFNGTQLECPPESSLVGLDEWTNVHPWCSLFPSTDLPQLKALIGNIVTAERE